MSFDDDWDIPMTDDDAEGAKLPPRRRSCGPDRPRLVICAVAVLLTVVTVALALAADAPFSLSGQIYRMPTGRLMLRVEASARAGSGIGNDRIVFLAYSDASGWREIGSSSFSLSRRTTALETEKGITADTRRVAAVLFSGSGNDPISIVTAPIDSNSVISITPTPTPTRQPTPTPKPTQRPTPTPGQESSFYWYDDSLRYYYYQLSADERELFETLYDAISHCRESAVFYGSVTDEEMIRVLHVLWYDCPELFHFDSAGSYYSYPDRIEFRNIQYRLSRGEYERECRQILDIYAGIQGSSLYWGIDFNKEYAIYRYLLEHCEYYCDDVTTTNADAALCHGRAQCSGYARALSLLLRMSDIPAIEVSGTADGGSHEWNLVKIDGDWYQCDVTWDDPTGNDYSFPEWNLRYMNLSDPLIGNDHFIQLENGFTVPRCGTLRENFAPMLEGYLIPADISGVEAYVQIRVRECYDNGQRVIYGQFEDMDDYYAFASNYERLLRDALSGLQANWTLYRNNETQNFTLIIHD